MIERLERRVTGPILLGLALLLFVLLAGCERDPQSYRLEGPIFGTGFHITFYGDYDDEKLADIEQSVKDALHDVDRLMSTYKPDSELSRFNQAEVGQPFELSPQTAEVVREAIRVGDISDGAFDVTVGAAVNLWGFGPDKHPDRVPDDDQIAEALKEVDYKALELDGNTLTKTKPVYVDLSGIAKGYGVDAVARALDALGVDRYLVEVGGEIRTRGDKPGGQPWRIAVEKPVSNERSVQRIIELDDSAVATSGDYRNYFESDGKRYSHTIDPRTGRPITHHLVSVTVITSDCMTADALATAIDVLGPDAGYTMAERENLAVYLVVKTPEGFETRVSTAFQSYLEDSETEDRS
ncbi:MULTISPECIES: FAD:protein FMN transferase [Salinicola]|uniref:FAD:protein FMN transferase n=1 Tax=Salinicola socius TaxID=404433 RepID=A0A1Q8SQ47_9GAMM|nr:MULTISPECIES: FAD:protein FMN transferase [Salinicola]OLO03555.1 FAD:protein FMN transferase ApbE [Salinicola socius]